MATPLQTNCLPKKYLVYNYIVYINKLLPFNKKLINYGRP